MVFKTSNFSSSFLNSTLANFTFYLYREANITVNDRAFDSSTGLYYSFAEKDGLTRVPASMSIGDGLLVTIDASTIGDQVVSYDVVQ